MWSGEAERVSRPVSCVSRRVRRTVTVCAVYRVWILCVVASTQSVFNLRARRQFLLIHTDVTLIEKPVAAPSDPETAPRSFAGTNNRERDEPVLLLVHRLIGSAYF